MSIGIWQIGIVVFGLTFGILILYFLYIAGIAVCEKSSFFKKTRYNKINCNQLNIYGYNDDRWN